MDKDKVHALITLLDDPSEVVFNSVEEELLKEELDVIDELEKAWEGSVDDVFQRRVENIIHTLQVKDVKSQLRKWMKEGCEELLIGAFLVAKYQYPELSYDDLNQKIDRFRRDVWLELNDHLTSIEKVRIINHILFDVHKFIRNNSNFFSPQNSYINDVVDSKKGNPISLSILYSVISQRLGLPIFGVNLPKNFVLCYLDENALKEDDDILFYINPINKGAILGRREIEYFLKQQKLTPKSEYFMPCSNKDIIKRVLINLIYSYDSQGNELKKSELQDLIKIFE